MHSHGNLGKSGLKITTIGLGCWQFSRQNNFAGKYWPMLEEDVIEKIVKVSLEGGINWFDTAELYGNGASERELSKALQKQGKNPGEVIIATKWWPMLRTATNILKTIDDRINALTPYTIDLYQVHQPYGFSSVKKEMEAMAELVKAKKIRYIGVSNFSAQQMRSSWEILEKQGISLVSNQVRYSLLDRKIESNGILETAKELGITIIAYSPLAQGLATGKFHDNPELLKNIGYRRYMPAFKPSGLAKSKPVVDLVKSLANKYSVTPSQIALTWVVSHNGGTVVAIPGATKETHALENVGAMKFRLSEEDLFALEKASKGFLN